MYNFPSGIIGGKSSSLSIYCFYLMMKKKKKTIKLSFMKESRKFFKNLYGSPKVPYSNLLLCYHIGFDEFF